MRVAHLDHRAAGELDREVQPLGGQQHHRGEEEHQRDDVEHQRMAHEGGGAADLEEFHGYTATFLSGFWCHLVFPMASFAPFLRPPWVPVAMPRGISTELKIQVGSP